MYLYYFFLNILFFFILLKFFLIIFKDKYIFPFRVAEIVNFITNISLNIIITINFFGYEFLLNTIATNCCLSFIFYNMLSMVNTSSRTKILLDLAQNGELNMRSYLRDYNEKIILDNRINRLKTNKEILINKNIIRINDKGFKFLKIVIFVFSLLKKI
jgi:hypothetical protein|tara:strand:+ start:4348 stop:4821 length:474 start_codon:yes stop_codon:yes gene_type:complete